MNSLIASKVAQAQQDAEKVFNDNPVVAFDDKKIRFGREFEILTSGDGIVVTAEIKDNRPKEASPLGKTDKAGGAVHASPSTESWGKPNRR